MPGSRQPTAQIVTVEINQMLAEALKREFNAEVICADFLEMKPEELGLFDVVIMNPPFVNASDIKHILHGLKFMVPFGSFAAICMNSSRQREQLKPIVEEWGGSWQPLPENSFVSVGTKVNTVMMSI